MRQPVERVYGGHMLVGRRAELEAIDRALEALSAGHPGVVEISGEPSAGRDAIVRAEPARRDLQTAAGWVELADDAAASCPKLGARQSEALRARAELLLAGGDPAGAADRALAAAAQAARAAVAAELADAKARQPA